MRRIRNDEGEGEQLEPREDCGENSGKAMSAPEFGPPLFIALTRLIDAADTPTDSHVDRQGH